MFFDKNILFEIIRPLRLEGVFVSLWTVGGEWSFDGPSEPLALFHFIAQGGIYVETKCGRKVVLHAGDLVIFPHGLAHKISSSSGVFNSTPLDSVLPKRELGSFARVDLPGSEKLTKILCAGLDCSTSSIKYLHDLVPEILLVRQEDMECQPLLNSVLKGLFDEAEAFKNGNEFVLKRGLELAYVLGITASLGVQAGDKSGVKRLIDPRIQKSLLHMHRDFYRRISVLEMAQEVGMSRSAFSSAFLQATGHTPAKYMSGIRVSEALHLMATTNLNQEQIASRVGFESSVGLYLAIKSRKRRGSPFILSEV